jgi:hypothetical protein
MTRAHGSLAPWSMTSLWLAYLTWAPTLVLFQQKRIPVRTRIHLLTTIGLRNGHNVRRPDR